MTPAFSVRLITTLFSCTRLSLLFPPLPSLPAFPCLSLSLTSLSVITPSRMMLYRGRRNVRHTKLRREKGRFGSWRKRRGSREWKGSGSREPRIFSCLLPSHSLSLFPSYAFMKAFLLFVYLVVWLFTFRLRYSLPLGSCSLFSVHEHWELCKQNYYMSRYCSTRFTALESERELFERRKSHEKGIGERERTPFECTGV